MRKNRRYYIYKYIEHNTIIYIGKTYRPLSERVYEHSLEAKFQAHQDSYVMWFEVDSMIEMDVAEKILISKYKPVLNVVDNDDSILKLSVFEEPEWKSYGCWRGFGSNGSGKYLWLHKKQQLNMLRLELRDLDVQESLWHHVNDWIDYMWDLYFDPGWDYLDDNKFTYQWDFDLYSIPDHVTIDNEVCLLYDTKTYVFDRHTYECIADTASVRCIMDSGKEAVSELLMRFTRRRLDLMELISKLE